jgi:hypothetical protein
MNLPNSMSLLTLPESTSFISQLNGHEILEWENIDLFILINDRHHGSLHPKPTCYQLHQRRQDFVRA